MPPEAGSPPGHLQAPNTSLIGSINANRDRKEALLLANFNNPRIPRSVWSVAQVKADAIARVRANAEAGVKGKAKAKAKAEVRIKGNVKN